MAIASSKSFLNEAPGPSPCYLQAKGSRLPGLARASAGDSKVTAGKTCVMRANDAVPVVNMYCHVEVFSPGLLLICRQAYAPTGNTGPVMMRGFQYGNLAPL